MTKNTKNCAIAIKASFFFNYILSLLFMSTKLNKINITKVNLWVYELGSLFVYSGLKYEYLVGSTPVLSLSQSHQLGDRFCKKIPMKS